MADVEMKDESKTKVETKPVVVEQPKDKFFGKNFLRNQSNRVEEKLGADGESCRGRRLQGVRRLNQRIQKAAQALYSE
jgi:hypothetical protein